MEETITYRVPEISSGHCEAAIIEEIRRVPGIASVSVDLDTKLVEITGTALDPRALIAAIDEAGYEAVIA